MFIVAFSSKISLISNQNNYKVGDIVRSDIYAPNTIIFKDQSAKEKIIEEMIRESGKEYIYSADAEKVYLEYYDEFFNSIYASKNNHIEDLEYNTIERNTNKKIPNIIIQELLALKTSQLKNLQGRVRAFLVEAYNEGIIKEKNGVFYKEKSQKQYNKEKD